MRPLFLRNIQHIEQIIATSTHDRSDTDKSMNFSTSVSLDDVKSEYSVDCVIMTYKHKQWFGCYFPLKVLTSI
jgi:hypothetical protein